MITPILGTWKGLTLQVPDELFHYDPQSDWHASPLAGGSKLSVVPGRFGW